MNISFLQFTKSKIESEQNNNSANQLLESLGLEITSYNREKKPIRAKSVELRENILVYKYSETEFAFIELLIAEEGEIIGIVDLRSESYVYIDNAHIRDRATGNERPVVTSDQLKNKNDVDGISIHALLAELIY